MCVDNLFKLIDSRIQKIMSKSSHINSEIAQVLNTDGKSATVKILATNTEYVLPNYSGSDIKVGDTVYVYWKGGFLSPQSAYIGASTRSDFPLTYINGINTIGNISSAKTEIAFKSVVSDCIANIVFNSTISASSVGQFTFTVYVDNVAEAYVPTGTTISGGYVNCNFTIPLSLSDAGDHNVRVVGNGVGTVTQMKSYIFGQGIKEGGTNG